MLTLPHRKYNKQVWKLLYRRFRISARELNKVYIDELMYGTGYYVFDKEGLPKHIPIQNVKIAPAPKV